MKQTTGSESPLARGPERFAAPEQAQERTSWAKVFGAFVALVVLVIGVPALLIAFNQPPPFPDGLPSRGDLTQPLSVDALLVVLRGVVWLAWLQFTICTVVEVLSLVRGGVLPKPVPLSGRSQGLARALVGTILIGGSLLGTSGAATAATLSEAPATSTSVATQAAEDRSDAGSQSTERGAETASDEADGKDEQPQMQHVPGVPSDMTDVIGHKVAIVQPPDGRYHDNLWDIAERHLGDGRLWQQIYDLNKGRIQPDGQELVLGRLIQPGWVLIMPDSAQGLTRVTEVKDDASGPRGDRGATEVGEQGVEQGAEAVADVQAAPMVQPGTWVGGGLLASVLAGALLIERRRRRGLDPTDDDLEAEVALRISADDDRVAWLDRSLRGLSATCRAERTSLPQVYAASVSDEHIELSIAPAAPTAPAPWTALDEGRTWRLAREADDPSDLGHAPYPGLVCLGRDDEGADVLVDLESLGGVVTFSGSDLVAREVVSALAVQLATAPWADEQRVRGYHLAPELADIAGSPLDAVTDLSALVSDLSSRRPRRAAQEVLSGRLGRHPGVAPEYLVLGARPDDEETIAHLSGLVSAGVRGLGVVSAVALPGARWRLTVDESGRLSVPLLDLEVDAVRLTASAADELSDLFAKARSEAPAPAGGRVSVPPMPRPGDDAHWGAAEVRVGLLGDLEVRAQGTLDPSRLDLARELAVFVALQPTPVHPSVIGASVWPRGVTSEVRDATIARVRDWLGSDADGNHLLRETEDGRVYLAEEVAVDWHAFGTLALRARDASPATEKDFLWRALRLVRGGVLTGRPAGRYSWLPRTRLERLAADLVEDTAHRLATLTLDTDPDAAALGCRTGLRLVPTSQVLWRDLLNAESHNPDGPGAPSVVEEMIGALQAAGVPADPETEALVAELLPDHPPAQEGGVSA